MIARPQLPGIFVFFFIVAGLISPSLNPVFAKKHHSENHAAFFSGTTVHEGQSSPSFAIDLEHHFNHYFGSIAVAEVIMDETMGSLVGLGFAYHPFLDLKLGLLPGVEIMHGHSEMLMRMDLEWAFHVQDWTLSPAVNIDYIDHHLNYIPGLAVGHGF